ncbi:MAG: hypothetical protein ABIS39_05440 [Sphingomicrobium sp.]
MTKGLFLRFVAAAAVAVPTAALAQSGPGAELIGQPIQVTTNGVTNIVYLDPGGSLRILTPASNTVAGTWQIAGGQLCLNVGGSTECIPYNSPFQAGAPQVFTTSCNASTTWLAQNVNNPGPAGTSERGR